MKTLNITVSLEENKRESGSFRQRAESAEQLVVKLENDLASAIGGSMTTGMSTLDVLRNSPSGEPNATSSPSEASLVPILTSQRNRLHEKVSQMEEMLAFEKQKQMAVQTEMEKMKSDNMKLYEKVRFLQGGSNKTSNIVIEDDSYERKFPNSDRNNRMQLHDRATLNIGRAILQNSNNRMIFFCYLLIIHVLIMLVLYKYAFDQATLRDAETECEYNFSQHMLHSHKEH